MSAVLVSHPHAAVFACESAAGFARAGKLASFFTGAAISEDSWMASATSLLATLHPVLGNRVLHGIPRGELHAFFSVELGARMAAAGLRRAGVPVKAYNSMFIAHDAAVALSRWPRDTTDVYAYEDAALWTFRRARRKGLGRIWDLPLPHWKTIDELFTDEATRWPGADDGTRHHEPPWKLRRKDEELALATRVSVASSFTKESLARIGCSVPVTVVPYGFPVEQFSPRECAPQGPFTVLAVGTHDLRKGTPYLLEAWRRAAIPGAELHLIGPLRLAKSFVDRYAGLFQHWPHVAKSDLPQRYAAADLLAFPTLGDGFGLVMQEAMACGTPVVTTRCGGGPESITNDVDGWLIPPRDIDALVETFRRAAADRHRTFMLGRAARARAERWTWREAGDALVSALSP